MKTTLRIRADRARSLRCKNLIAVLESPKTIENIASTICNVDALGVEKVYVVDSHKLLPDNWLMNLILILVRDVSIPKKNRWKSLNEN